MKEVQQISDNDSEKNKKSNHQKGLDQGCHGGAETITLNHAINNGENKQKQGSEKQARLKGVNHAPLPVTNLSHHFIPPVASKILIQYRLFDASIALIYVMI